jgi:uncharacterized protein YkwD
MLILHRRAGVVCAAMLLVLCVLRAVPAAAQPGLPTSSNLVYLPMVTSKPNDSLEAIIAQQVVDLTNQERVKHGCAPLAFSPDLSAAAERHSRDMAINDLFSHTGSDGSTMQTRIADTGYNYTRLAENIAVGQSSAVDVVQVWMSSNAGHRDNILNCDLREIGVGFYDQPDDQANVRDDSGATSGPYRFYWTQDFGTSQ